jgi:two-component system copper resistance phosphate regulon response regulator CusR
MRALPQHKKTPVIFVTSLSDFDNRASSMMSGGNDFIGKPFLFIELTVKALIHVLRGKLQPAK